MAQKLHIAFWSYDRTRLLADGSVKIEGADVAFHSARIVPEIFEAMIRRRAYDVCAAWMVPRNRTSMSRMRSSNAGNFSSILPLRNSLAL